MVWLVISFLGTALLYGAAGFGGGSTYTALLILFGAALTAVPVISLSCNILVVTVGASRFARAGHVDLRRIWPLFAMSVPAAFIGGAIPVGRLVFMGLLSASLIVAGLFLLWRPTASPGEPRAYPRWFEPIVGGLLGLLSGVVGIGGGIFLAPVLYLARWGSPRSIAGTSAVFILVNSISGLAGQLYKSGAETIGIIASYWPLFPAVLIGGAIGSALTATRIDQRYLRLVTALLVLFVGGRLAIDFARAING
jgi:uncharacterized membrane protein YfcA